MAHIEIVRNAELRKHLDGRNRFYAISSSVGYGCPNRANDVRLVQFLVNRAYGRKVLVVDGSYGGQTWRHIKSYQEMVMGINGGGLVSAADGTKCMSPKGRNLYTIFDLNMSYFRLQPFFSKDPSLDPEFPKEVLAQIRSRVPELV